MIRVYRHFVATNTLIFTAIELCIVFILFHLVVRLVGPPTDSLTSPTALSVLLVLTTALSGVAAGFYQRAINYSGTWLLSAAVTTGLALALGGLVVLAFAALSSANGIVIGQLEIALPVICPICFLATRWAAVAATSRGLFMRPVLLIGAGRKAAEIEAFAAKSGSTIKIVRRLSTDGGDASMSALAPELSAAYLKAEGIGEAVIAADEPRGLPMGLLFQWKVSGIAVTDYQTFWEREAGFIAVSDFDPAWFVYADGCRRGWTGRVIKRVLDIVLGVALLVATAPLFCLCALLIYLETPGGVFYRQERSGRYGIPFDLIKFRSMRNDAEPGTPQWASQNDPRVTRIGKYIRSTRIDELPQLINVIRGDMSLVGPRPERPFFVDQLSQNISHYADRHYVRPGLTGWAQINYPYGATVEDARQKLSYDFYYIKNQSILLDLFILLSTVRVVLFREGAR